MSTLSSAIGGFYSWLKNGHPLARINRVPIITFALLLGMFLLTEGARHREYTLIHTVGLDTTPSVEKAHNIKAGIARMAQDLFTEIAALPGENYDLIKDFDANRKVVDSELVEAARNITYTNDALNLHASEPTGEVGPITRLQEGYAQFIALTAKARVFHENGDAASLAVVREIDVLVKNNLLPAADALAMVNDAHNQYEYASRAEHFKTALIAIGGIGGLLVLYLAYVQFFVLTRTFKRGVNPFYAAATAVAVVFMLYAANSFRLADKELYNAGTNAYPSVKALAETRAHLLQAKAEQSIWLLDRPNADIHQKAFNDFVGKVGKLANGANVDQIIALTKKGYAATSSGYSRVGNGDAIPSSLISGSLADELNNITFNGELDAATQAVKAYADFLALDAKIRGLENQGQHGKAVSLLAGANPGQGNYVFEQVVDDAATRGSLGTALKINKDELSTSVDRAFAAISLLEWGTPAVLLLVQLLTFGGTLMVRSGASPARAAARWRAGKA